MSFWQYVSANDAQVMALIVEHIQLTAISVGLAICIGVPLGLFISYTAKANKPILSVANIIQAIPSMALLGFMIPFFGIGTVPAVVAVVLYSLLPIIKNTYTGISNINPQTVEAARGIGLTRIQVLAKIQIPLALPVIMAGIRIASVTAVGLMTMAAFIGAGGLGFLVFSGIRTVNTSQILAGAIPACILALLVDYFIGIIERIVTPISLQKGDMVKIRKRRKAQKAVLAAGIVLMFGIVAYQSVDFSEKNVRTISVGTKDYTEQHILGNMVADLIEARTDIHVNRKVDLGGTQVCFGALQTGDIDLYIDYSGTCYTDTLKLPPISDMEQVYNTVKSEFKKRYDIETLKHLGFNNTYALAVTKQTADQYGLTKVSDFAKVASSMKSGTTFEFSNRDDGMSGLQKAYGFKVNEALTLDSAPRYAALVNGEVDVIDAFTTDGLLKKFNLITLEDDKRFFPPYYAIPLVRAESLAKYPEIIPIMEELGDILTNDVMIELNYRVDELQESPDKVAREFLKAQGLIQ